MKARENWHGVGGALALAVWLVAPAGRAQTAISVDFTEPADYPLLKDKLNLYDTSIPTTADFERDAKLLGLLNLESLRLEQSWGYGHSLSNVVGGTPENLAFDFSAPDRWQDLVTQQGVLLHWSYDYTPKVLSAKPGDIPPEAGWNTCIEAAWRHWRERGQPIVLDEVWNEPDFTAFGFFNGSQQDFFALYARTAKKLRSLDGDAKIAGPTTAFPFWLGAFADYVHEHQLPLDALTFHQYTRLGPNDHIAQAAAALSRYPEFATVEMVMDEYHSSNPWPKDGPQQTFEGATELLYDAWRFGRRPELTSLNWAQFQDPGPNTDQWIGLVTPDGHPKASFNALQLYGMLPVDSVGYTVQGAAIDVLASSDSRRAGVVLLNRTGADQSVQISLRKAPFARGNMRSYRIDAGHNSYLNGAGEGLTPTDQQSDVELAGWSFTGTVPNHATLAFLFDDGSGHEPPKSVALGKIARVNRYYPSRTTAAYADFDRRTWVARLGMATETQADTEVGVTAENMPKALRFSSQLSGTPQHLDRNTLLGVRLDYATASGYARSVLFHGPYAGGTDLYDVNRDAPMPFGTRRQADVVVQVPNFADFVVTLAEHAPADASGRIAISYLMQNTGPGTRVVITTAAVEDEATAGSGGAGGGIAGAGNVGGATANGAAGSLSGGVGAGQGGVNGNAGAPGTSGGSDPNASPSAATAPSSCACNLADRSRSQASLAWLVALLFGVLLRRRPSPTLRVTFGALLAALSLGCEGFITGSNGAPGPVAGGHFEENPVNSGQGGRASTPVDCATAPSSALPARLRRLTQSEYLNSLKSLVGDGVSLPSLEFPPDAALGSYHNAATLLRVTDLLADGLAQAAQTLAASATQQLPSLLGCEPAGSEEESCVRGFLTRFAAKAYRRPVNPAELDRLMTVYRQGRTDADVRAGVALALEVIFQSPYLLYRTELGAPDATGAETTLTPYETATELAYLLTLAPPDAELLRAADAGELTAGDARAAQATRLLQQSAARQAMATFATEWLDIGSLPKLSKDPAMFPSFSPQFARDLQQQTEQRFSATVFEGDGKLSSLLLGGLLEEPSVLAAHAGTQWSSPTHRGKMIRNQLLCQTVPPPPPGLIVTVPPAVPGATTRQRMLRHASDPSCAACHQQMDPLGFAFEHYDAIGAFRADEAGLTIDSSGQVSGGTDADGDFDGAASLSKRLAVSSDVRACFARQWTSYALGAEVSAELACALSGTLAEFRADKLSLPQLLVSVVRADAFVKRHVESP